MLRRDRNAPQETTVWMHIRLLKNSIIRKITGNVFAHTGQTRFPNAHTDNSAHMLTANSKSSPNWSTTTFKMRTFTCSTTRLSSVFWTWLSTKKTSAYTLIIGKITVATPLSIRMNLSPVSTGILRRWYMTTCVGVAMVLPATPVMAGKNNLIILFSTRPTNVRIKIAEKDPVPTIIQKKKEGSLTSPSQANASSLSPKTESWKESLRTPPSRPASSLNPSLRKSALWYTRRNNPTRNL